MRTHIELDEQLIDEVVKMGRFPSKKAAVHAALTEYAKLIKRQQLMGLRGRIAWQGDLEQMRADRVGRAD
jgi:Arc/MetJ family transcription regulator